jgi:SAM-dependent methyltransferase
MDIIFDHQTATPLCEIMGRNRSDKGSSDITRCWHNYTTAYHALFKDIRMDKLRVFELGLGTNNTSLPSNMGANGRPCASLYGWSEYFPNSDIFGADIDRNILYNNDKFRTYYCDQTNPIAIKDMWNHPDLIENFDIIVEDGLHQYEANVCFFENSIHKLKPNGWFIIEDIGIYNLKNFENKIKTWESTYTNCQFKIIKIPSVVNHTDNTLIVIHKLPSSN